MIRLLRFTAVLIGLFLVTFVLGGAFIRPAHSDEWIPLMVEWNSKGSAVRYFQVWPGVDAPLNYDLSIGSEFLGIDTTGRHAYFSALPPGLTIRNYYQDDSRLWPTVENVYTSTVYASSDFTWMLYGADAADGGWDYYVTNLHTGKRWNISDLVGRRSVAYRANPLFSADETWLYLTVQERDLTRYEIIGIHLPSGSVVDITQGQGTTGWTQLRALVADWLVFDSGDAVLYRIRTDGSDFGVLFELPPQTETTYPIFVHATYPTYDMLLLRHDRTLYALDVAAAELRWQQLDLTILDAPLSSMGWITIFQRGYPLRLHLPTGESNAMPFNDDPTANYLRDSPTGRATIFTRFDKGSRRHEWREHDWATGESWVIPASVEDLTLQAISPDGEWLWVKDNEHMVMRRIRIRDGYTETVMPLDTFHDVVGWMRPDVQSWHPPLLLLMALALMLIGILPRRLLKLRHTPPSFTETK